MYRWGEDGIGGISDDQQRLCFALALWNCRDPILKERLFGLTGNQGNHGEDVKEYYFYLDATPTGSYLKMLYKYPQAAFPYADLSDVNAQRSREKPEYELIDTEVFAENRYFDVVIEYAKAGPDDILVRISATNRGPEAADASPASNALVPKHLVLGHAARHGPETAPSAGRLRYAWQRRHPCRTPRAWTDGALL